MMSPQVLHQRIRARKDISDEESASDSEAQGVASETESASEASPFYENAVDLKEDTSDQEVRINLALFHGLSESSSNPPLLPRRSPTTHQAYLSAPLPAHKKRSENATALHQKHLPYQSVYAFLMTVEVYPLIIARLHCPPGPQNTPLQPNPRNTPSPAAVKSSQRPKSWPATPASILLPAL